MNRKEAVEMIVASLTPTDVLVSTTGLISRQVFATEDRPRNFYMLGSMGLASALALGLALLRPDDRVVVLEGDGSALMSLGTLPLIGVEAPPNLLHIVLDNAAYESTGGQPSISASIRLSSIGQAAGYAAVMEVDGLAALGAAMQDLVSATGPALLVANVTIEALPETPRVSLSPAEIRDRFTASLGEHPQPIGQAAQP